jgi:hypothetical protein
MVNLAVSAAVALAIIAAGLAIWLVPRRQVQRWRRAGITEEAKLAELGVQARSSITQALGGLALIATLAITAYQANETRRSADATQRSADNNLRLAEQGQVSERFSRTVEQLGTTNADGSAAIDVRAGALFSLRQIGLDSEAYAQPAFLVAATYVANNYRPPSKPRPHGCDRFRPPRPDIANAFRHVLPALAKKRLEDAGESILLGLRGVDLAGLAVDKLVLQRFNLTGVKFNDASLVDADFRESNLSSANFHRACLSRVDFRQADLRGTDLSDAELDGADLRGATVSRTTDFKSARLKGAKFTATTLEQASLSKAQRDVIVVSP